MSKKEISVRILQVGESDWSTYSIPGHAQVTHLPVTDLASYIARDKEYREQFENQQKLLAELREKKQDLPKEERLAPPIEYSALLVTVASYPDELSELVGLFEVYTVFCGHDVTDLTPVAQMALEKKLAQTCDTSQPESLLEMMSRALFSGQYGAKLAATDLQVSPDFVGRVVLAGQSHLVLTGNFGSDFQQLAYFRYNLPLSDRIGLDLFFEHLLTDDVETKVKVCLLPDGSLGDIVKEWEFDLVDRNRQLHLESEMSGVLTISFYAKGTGELKLGPCHYRNSRADFGQFILGGERFVDQDQQEFMYYFDPQDFKPPLCVYFSGFRTAEGFEGFWMMKSFKTPFMLICDPRLEGGSFYMGSPELEQRISDVIQEKLDFLGFDRSQLILSGMSMGTFGATYHGAKLSPHAIIISKPVLSLGEVALKERIIRPGGFPTTLDILSRYTGRLDEEGGAQLDEYFWRQLRQGDFSKTSFFVAYMKHDDYDATAFQKLLEVTRGTTATVIGRGWDGRHLDGGDGPIIWFLKQYQQVLAEDFGR